MGQPIQVVITAESEAALKNIQNFVAQANSGLNQLSTAGTQGLKQMAQGAKEASTHIAGLSYYARSAGDSIRYALAGGGARAGFYALDEMLRGLLASGIGLSTLLPVLGAVAAAAGGGFLIWREYTSAEREAEQAAKDLKTQLEGQVKLVTHLKDLQKAGLMSPQAIQKNLDYLSGKTPLYKDAATGQITTSPTPSEEIPPVNYGMSFGAPPGPTQAIANQKATALEVQKYIQDNLTIQGKLDDSSIEAANKLKDLREEIHTQSLTEAEQEKQKIHEKYQSEREDIDKLAAGMGVLLTPEKQRENEAAKALSLQNEAREQAAVDFKTRQEETQKADEAAAASKEYYSKIVAQENSDLERKLTLDAANAGKTREENFQHEYQARMFLLTQQYFEGSIDEKQYTEAVQEATAKRIEGVNRELADQQRLHEEMVRFQQEDARQTGEETLRNPAASQTAKQQALQGLIDQTKQLLDQNQTEIELAETEKQRNELIQERQRLEHQYSQYQVEQLEQEKSMNDARVTGVRTMFGQMGQAAKAFGSEGVAVYRGFAIAQAVIDTAKAAIGAYSSVVGIPYIGPILAPAAAAAAVAAGAVQIAAIESASARERGGPVSAGSPYIVGERGPELLIPASDGHIVNANDTARMMGFSGQSGSARSAASSSAPKISVNLFNDLNAINKHAKDNPEFSHILVDIMRGKASYLQPQ